MMQMMYVQEDVVDDNDNDNDEKTCMCNIYIMEFYEYCRNNSCNSKITGTEFIEHKVFFEKQYYIKSCFIRVQIT